MSYPTIVPGGGLLVSYQLHGKRVLIVGGGPVAAGRLVNVKDADAHVTVLAPRSGLCKEMAYRIQAGSVDEYLDRTFGAISDELDLPLPPPSPQPQPQRSPQREAPPVKYDLVLTAIDDADVSRAICRACRARRIPVNVADVPPECDFYFGSLIRRGALQVMVSTGGRGPKLAALIRQRIGEALPESVGPAIDAVGKLRSQLRRIAPSPQDGKKRMAWMSKVCTTWSFEDLARLDDEQMQVLLRGYEAAPPAVLGRDAVLHELGQSASAPRGSASASASASTSASTSDGGGGSARFITQPGRALSSLSGIASEALASPWGAGLAGALTGAALTAALFCGRVVHHQP